MDAASLFESDEPVGFLNGRYVPAAQMQLPVSDLGLVAAAAATEMLRTFAGSVGQVDEHLARLQSSLDYLGIVIEPSRAELEQIIRRLAAQHYRLIDPGSDVGVVVFATAGQNLTYLGPQQSAAAARPTVAAHTFELPFALWSERLRTGQHLRVSSVPAMPAAVLDPRYKIRSRAHWYLADRQVRALDPQASALLVDERGFVTETSSGNLCIVRDGEICYPDPQRTLPGISLHVCRRLAEELGLKHTAADLTPDDVAAADEAWTTSTPYCMLPVTRFNGQPIGDGRPGRTFSTLLDRWSQQCGVDLRRQLGGD